MFKGRSLAIGSCLILIVLSTSGCLVRTTHLPRAKTPSGAKAALLSADLAQLVQHLHKIYDTTSSFNATVDMTPETGSVYKGEITEYKDIKGYILYRKPSDIRVIGLAPVVRSKVFDMVSNGNSFQILIPPKNRLIEGRNDAAPLSKNSLENLRPEAFLRAMLVRPPDEANETPILVDSTDEVNAQYVMVLIAKSPEGKLSIRRTIFFDRTNLSISRQREYDSQGTIVSDTRYQDWKMYKGGIAFPSTTTITRPVDGYGVSMTIVKLDGNEALSNDKFVLQKPPGVQVQMLGSAASAQGAAK